MEIIAVSVPLSAINKRYHFVEPPFPAQTNPVFPNGFDDQQQQQKYLKSLYTVIGNDPLTVIEIPTKIVVRSTYNGTRHEVWHSYGEAVVFRNFQEHLLGKFPSKQLFIRFQYIPNLPDNNEGGNYDIAFQHFLTFRKYIAWAISSEQP